MYMIWLHSFLTQVVAAPTTTHPQCANLRRSFHCAAVRLQDESKDDKTSATSSSSTSSHAHYQSEQDTAEAFQQASAAEEEASSRSNTRSASNCVYGMGEMELKGHHKSSFRMNATIDQITFMCFFCPNCNILVGNVLALSISYYFMIEIIDIISIRQDMIYLLYLLWILIFTLILRQTCQWPIHIHSLKS